MLSYCLECRKITESKITRFTRAKKFAGSNTSGGVVKSKILQNKELAKNYTNKPIARKFEKRKVNSSLVCSSTRYSIKK